MQGPQESGLHEAVKTLVQRFGTGIVTNADNFRAALDDWAEEDDAAEAALLVDAVRYGAVDLLQRSTSVPGSDPATAIERASEHLTRQRGGTDAASARWAVAVLGSALNLTSDSLVSAQPEISTAPPPPPPPPGELPTSFLKTETGVPPTEDTPRPPPPPPPHIPPGGDTVPIDRPVPVPPGPSRKGLWILIGSIVAVLAIVGTVVAVAVGGGGGGSGGSKDDPTKPRSSGPTEPDQPERITTDVLTVASHFSGLGNFSSASSCRSEALTDGYKERVVCTFGDFEVLLVDVADQAHLDADRAQLATPPGEPVLNSTATGPSGSFAQSVYDNTDEGQFPNGGSQLYWDSTAAMQSAKVLSQDQTPSPNTLREWYKTIGAPTAAPDLDIAPFTNLDLYVYFTQFSYMVDESTCEEDRAQARRLDLSEYVDCTAVDGFDVAYFAIAKDLSAFRDGLPNKGDSGFHSGGPWTFKGKNRTEGIYRVYANCVDPCEADTDFYTAGYRDDVDTATLLKLYSADGVIDFTAMEDQIGLGG